MNKKGMEFFSVLLLAGILGGCSMPQEEKPVTQESKITEEQTIWEEAGVLSKDELDEYTKWIQGYGVYGFLLSDWSVPAEVNLWDVVYSGAGLSETPTEEQIRSYLDLTGQEELYTEFFVIPKSGLDLLLSERLGKTYDELMAEGNEGMEDIYDPVHDCYGIQAGDTNYTEFVAETGERLEDGRILLHYRNSHKWEEYGWIEAGELELLEDGRVLLSNHITEGTVLQ